MRNEKKTFVQIEQEKILGSQPSAEEDLRSIVLSLKAEVEKLRAEKNKEAAAPEMVLLSPSTTLENTPGSGKILFYSKYHALRIGLRHQRAKRIPMQGGEYEKVTVGESLHAEFCNNRCWIPKEYLEHLRHAEGYGFDFIEALDSPGIPYPHKSMEAMAMAPENSEGERQFAQWTEKIEENGKRARIPTPLKQIQISKQVLRIRAEAEAIAV